MHEDENIEEDSFFVTGKIIVESGCLPDGSLQWRWRRDDIEPALALGFLEIMREELKRDIIEASQEDWEEGE